MNIAILLALAVIPVGVNDDSRDKAKFVYDSPARLDTILVFDERIIVGSIAPKTLISGQNQFWLESFGLIVSNCSTKNIRCWIADDISFALPINTREIKGEYVTSAGTMMMEECLRGHGDQCQIMRLRMDSAKYAGVATYYVYNEDYGIVSFGIASAGEKPQSPAQAAAIANQYILQGERGLFHPEGKAKARRK